MKVHESRQVEVSNNIPTEQNIDLNDKLDLLLEAVQHSNNLNRLAEAALGGH